MTNQLMQLAGLTGPEPGFIPRNPALQQPAPQVAPQSLSFGDRLGDAFAGPLWQLGMGIMAAGGQPGATFLGSLGQGGLAAAKVMAPQRRFNAQLMDRRRQELAEESRFTRRLEHDAEQGRLDREVQEERQAGSAPVVQAFDEGDDRVTKQWNADAGEWVEVSRAPRSSNSRSVNMFNPRTPTFRRSVREGSEQHRRLQENGWVEGDPRAESPGGVINLVGPNGERRSVYSNSPEAQSMIASGEWTKEGGMDFVDRQIVAALAARGGSSGSVGAAGGPAEEAASSAGTNPLRSGSALTETDLESVRRAQQAYAGALDDAGRAEIRQRLEEAGIDPSVLDAGAN